MRTALIVGATGLVGKQCLYQLLEDKEYLKVFALVRKEINIKHHKLEQVIVNFDELEKYEYAMKVDDVFCCLGTTIGIAKTQENFRKVDFDYPVKIAELTLKNGANQFMLVSSMGASKNSSIFYSRVKGEVEEAIAKIGFKAFHIFRPSMLMGDRTDFRFGEIIGKYLMKVIGILFFGPLKKYKGIQGIVVAKAMVRTSQKNISGNHIHLSDEIQKIGK